MVVLLKLVTWCFHATFWGFCLTDSFIHKIARKYSIMIHTHSLLRPTARAYVAHAKHSYGLTQAHMCARTRDLTLQTYVYTSSHTCTRTYMRAHSRTQCHTRTDMQYAPTHLPRDAHTHRHRCYKQSIHGCSWEEEKLLCYWIYSEKSFDKKVFTFRAGKITIDNSWTYRVLIK